MVFSEKETYRIINNDILKITNDQKLELLSYIFNRSQNQIGYLLSLVFNDINTLYEVERAIKYLNISYCPSDTGECYKLIGLHKTFLKL